MSNPYQSFSCQGSNSTSKSYKPKEPKLTVERLVNAVPKLGSITQRQLARKVNCSTDYVKKVSDVAIEQGLIATFTVSGVEKNFKRSQCII